MDDSFVFYVIDYFATGEGRTIWLYASREYGKAGREHARKEVEEWSGWFYANGITEVSQEDFFGKYGHFIPECIAKAIINREAPGLTFKQEFYFNYS